MFKVFQDKNLDVYSIQNKAEDILYALSGLESLSVPDDFYPINFEGIPILFKNLKTKFVLNDIEIPLHFPICLYYKGALGENEHEGKIITFMQGSTFTQDTIVSDSLVFKKGEVLNLDSIRKILYSKGIKFIEDDALVKGIEEGPSDISQTLTQEIWFGRDMNILPESLDSIQEKKIIIYPNVKGQFQLIWFVVTEGIVIYEMNISGLVQLDDKIMLRIMPSKDVVDAINLYEHEGIPVTSHLKYDPLRWNPETLKELENQGFEIYRSDELPEFLKDVDSVIRK